MDPIVDGFRQIARLFEEKTGARLARRPYPNLTIVLSKAGSERHDPSFAVRGLADAFSECVLETALRLGIPTFVEIDEESQSALCPLNRLRKSRGGPRTFLARRAPGCDRRHFDSVTQVTRAGSSLKTGHFL